MNTEQNLDSFLQYVSGKTSKESCQPMTTPSDVSFQDLWDSTFQSIPLMDENFQRVATLSVPREAVRGDCLTLNTSEAPNHVRESTLWQVLVKDSIPEKYYLSSRACEGIISRAERKGKPLPPLLRLALETTIKDQAKEQAKEQTEQPTTKSPESTLSS